MLNETSLIESMARGEESALEILFELHYERLWKYCNAILRNPTDTDEVVNDAFHRAFRYACSFRNEGTFSAWIFRISKNLCKDFLRKKKHHTTSICDTEELTDGMKFLKDEILEAVQMLNSEQRNVFILKHIAGYSLAEISRMTEKSIPAVKSIHHRGMLKMRELLK